MDSFGQLLGEGRGTGAPDVYELSGRRVEVRRESAERFRLHLDGERSAVCFAKRPGRERALALAARLRSCKCLACEAVSVLALSEALQACGWDIAPDAAGAVCPRHSREGVSYHLQGELLVAVCAAPGGRYRLWLGAQRSAVCLRQAPGRERALELAAALRSLHCRLCGARSELDLPDELTAAGWCAVHDDGSAICPRHRRPGAEMYESGEREVVEIRPGAEGFELWRTQILWAGSSSARLDDFERSLITFPVRPDEAEVRATLAGAQRPSCWLCERETLVRPGELAAHGWYSDPCEPSVHICPEHRRAGVDLYRDAGDLVEVRPGEEGFELWVARTDQPFGKVRVGDFKRSRLVFAERPDELRVMQALGDALHVHCDRCHTDSELAWPEDHLDDGWALSAECELCPGCNDLDAEELDAFSDHEHPYWRRRDAELQLRSGNGLG